MSGHQIAHAHRGECRNSRGRGVSVGLVDDYVKVRRRWSNKERLFFFFFFSLRPLGSVGAISGALRANTQGLVRMPTAVLHA